MISPGRSCCVQYNVNPAHEKGKNQLSPTDIVVAGAAPDEPALQAQPYGSDAVFGGIDRALAAPFQITRVTAVGYWSINKKKLAEVQKTTIDDRLAKRNVAILAYAQAILGSQMSIHIILGGLAGAYLANDASLTTLPISITVLVSMFTAPAASLMMGRYGRRAGFLTGALFGAIGGALSTTALIIGSFETLLAGTAFTGVYQAFQGFYRFAAADTASEGFKPKAISWVLAGGLVSALIGPETVHVAADLFAPVPFAGAYIAIVVINIVGAFGLLFLRIPLPPTQVKGASTGRPLAEIFRQPKVVVAVLCAMISYALMGLVMTSTPLAMVNHGFTPDHAADVVRFHVIAMFAPSFVTGSLIARYGHGKIIGSGLALLGACGVIATAGVELAHFYWALIVLGVG